MLIYRTDDGACDIAVDYDRYEYDRWCYRWTISVGGETVATGADLRSGCTTQDRPAPLAEMLESLCSFLGAFTEARQYGTPESDNWTLFPDAVADVAGAYADELAMYTATAEGDA